MASAGTVWEIGSANGLAAVINYNLYKPHSSVLRFACIAAQSSQQNRWSLLAKPTLTIACRPNGKKISIILSPELEGIDLCTHHSSFLP